jgi:hypothetical protein
MHIGNGRKQLATAVGPRIIEGAVKNGLSSIGICT